jgi:hypothetical protein
MGVLSLRMIEANKRWVEFTQIYEKSYYFSLPRTIGFEISQCGPPLLSLSPADPHFLYDRIVQTYETKGPVQHYSIIRALFLGFTRDLPPATRVKNRTKCLTARRASC